MIAERREACHKWKKEKDRKKKKDYEEVYKVIREKIIKEKGIEKCEAEK